MSRLPSPRHPKTSALSVAQEGTRASAAWLPFEPCVFVRLLYLIKIVPPPTVYLTFITRVGGGAGAQPRSQKRRKITVPPLRQVPSYLRLCGKQGRWKLPLEPSSWKTFPVNHGSPYDVEANDRGQAEGSAPCAGASELSLQAVCFCKKKQRDPILICSGTACTRRGIKLSQNSPGRSDGRHFKGLRRGQAGRETPRTRFLPL